MNPPFEVLKLSEIDKDRLTKIKRATAIPTMNIICRWALTIGLKQAESFSQGRADDPRALEIKWPVFAGDFGDVISALIYREFEKQSKKTAFKNAGDFAHNKIKLGLAILSRPGAVRSLEDFVNLAI